LLLEGGTEDRHHFSPPPESVTPDVLAYYLPYHLYEPGAWGIYLRAEGIARLARDLKGRPLDLRDALLLDAARDILYEHEYYHCVVETAATKAELVATHPVYRLYLYDLAGGEHEEGLANAHAIRMANRRHARIVPALREWMRQQPAGYRDFEKWHGPRRFDSGRSESAQHIMGHLPTGGLARPPLSGEFLLDGVKRSRIPTYTVVEKGSRIGVAKPFPKSAGMRVLVHTRDHPPPHFHLQAPPDRDRGRFRWPDLEPVGAPRLTGSERKRLDRYLGKFGEEIGRRIAEVYEDLPGVTRP
jgi:hypothetical protein